ncbi:MAG: extracellular solute-binding protein [Ardenticatenales bacterium]|nr:extracellular solute-binding protein [Ardenticatenales bacterium]
MRSAQELLESGESIPWDRLLAEARTEAALTTIALPHDWANYGEILSTVRERYGLRITELNPAAGSGEELEAIELHKEKGGSGAPDVLDIGLGFTESAKEKGLLAPYKVAPWASIPENARDPDGYWCGNYYGVLAFEANLSLVKTVPLDWPDLLRPEYKNMVALAGDPTLSNQAIYSVWAAGLSRTGSLEEAPMAGLEFFAELHRIGNFVPLIADVYTVAAGDTPITIQWDYLGLSNRDTLKGEPDVAVVIPDSGILAGLYAQAISAYAPHPFAARLWSEFLFSDEGQLLWLEGYVHPIRYNELVAAYKVPLELAAKLPPPDSYARALFPTVPQITTAHKIITENWHRVVLGDA